MCWVGGTRCCSPPSLVTQHSAVTHRRHSRLALLFRRRPLRHSLIKTDRGNLTRLQYSVCKESVNFSLEILRLYWNSLSFRGGSAPGCIEP